MRDKKSQDILNGIAISFEDTYDKIVKVVIKAMEDKKQEVLADLHGTNPDADKTFVDMPKACPTAELQRVSGITGASIMMSLILMSVSEMIQDAMDEAKKNVTRKDGTIKTSPVPDIDIEKILSETTRNALKRIKPNLN